MRRHPLFDHLRKAILYCPEYYRENAGLSGPAKASIPAVPRAEAPSVNKANALKFLSQRLDNMCEVKPLIAQKSAVWREDFALCIVI